MDLSVEATNASAETVLASASDLNFKTDALAQEIRRFLAEVAAA